MGTSKTAFIDLKGFDFASGDLGSGNNGNIKLAVQENSHVLKLHATRPFAETNLFLTGEDTSVQFLIKYQANPVKNYYSYYLGGLQSVLKHQYDSLMYAAKKAGRKKDDIEDSTESIPVKAPPVDTRTELEKNASVLINPKNKLFSRVRSKNQNVAYGDLHKGVRIYLEKLYRSGNLTYFMIKIANTSMGEFQLEEFQINKVDGADDDQLNIINEESAFNLLKRFEKVDFIVIAENLELTATGKLVFKFKSTQDKQLSFKFELTQKDFQKRETL